VGAKKRGRGLGNWGRVVKVKRSHQKNNQATHPMLAIGGTQKNRRGARKQKDCGEKKSGGSNKKKRRDDRWKKRNRWAKEVKALAGTKNTGGGKAVSSPDDVRNRLGLNSMKRCGEAKKKKGSQAGSMIKNFVEKFPTGLEPEDQSSDRQKQNG